MVLAKHMRGFTPWETFSLTFGIIHLPIVLCLQLRHPEISLSMLTCPLNSSLFKSSLGSHIDETNYM